MLLEEGTSAENWLRGGGTSSRAMRSSQRTGTYWMCTGKLKLLMLSESVIATLCLFGCHSLLLYPDNWQISRIPSAEPTDKVVLMYHGLWGSSAVWVLGPPDQVNVQSHPLNGSLNNGLVRFIVHDLAGPSYNAPLVNHYRIMVQFSYWYSFWWTKPWAH